MAYQQVPDQHTPEIEDVPYLTIKLSPDVHKTLQELAAKDGTSVSDALLDAIALSKFVSDTRKQGGDVLVEHNGKLRRIVKKD